MLIEFNNESMGDKIKVLIFLLFLLFLFHNYMNWKKVMGEMKHLENKVDNIFR
jgi:regulatory protein YycI of two-component signal transduction system YycFG